MGRVTLRRRLTRLVGSVAHERTDTLVVEEPMEIRLQGRALTVTMRTPGDDFDLAAGFLVGEGVIGDASDIVSMRYCAGAGEDGLNTYNVVDVQLREGVDLPAATLERNFYTTSSCGLCGKASLDAVRLTSRWKVADDEVRFVRRLVSEMPERLREAQRIFDRTGGLHAAALFSASGELMVLREDVGRHNAVDKVVGSALRSGAVPLRGSALMVSGRASFELVQKAVMAGIPLLAAVSAPSSLAVELADDAGLTLAGFVRGDSMNVYTRPDRIVEA